MQSSTRPCFNLTLKKGILGSLIKHINARLRIIIIIAVFVKDLVIVGVMVDQASDVF